MQDQVIMDHHHRDMDIMGLRRQCMDHLRRHVMEEQELFIEQGAIYFKFQ